MIITVIVKFGQFNLYIKSDTFCEIYCTEARRGHMVHLA